MKARNQQYCKKQLSCAISFLDTFISCENLFHHEKVKYKRVSRHPVFFFLRVNPGYARLFDRYNPRYLTGTLSGH